MKQSSQKAKSRTKKIKQLSYNEDMKLTTWVMTPFKKVIDSTVIDNTIATGKELLCVTCSNIYLQSQIVFIILETTLYSDTFAQKSS